MSFKRILVPVERRVVSQLALDVARRVAEKSGASVSLVEVIPPGAAGGVAELEAELEATCREELERLAQSLESAGISTSLSIRRGRSYEEIIRAVIDDAHDLVVKVAGEEGWFRETFLGTTDLNLLRKCPCPVWIVHEEGASGYGRILAALHLDPENENGSALDRRILEIATTIGRMHSSEVHVAHCYDPMAGGWLERRLGEERYRAWIESARESASRAFEEAIAPFASEIPPERRHLVRGDPGMLLPRLASELSVDLIVLGSVARVGVPGLLVGNTAERVLAQVRASVLTIKPESFVSPIPSAGSARP